MIYTPKEYSKTYPIKGKHVSAKTIVRRCKSGNLPSGHTPYKKKKNWIIEVRTPYKTKSSD